MQDGWVMADDESLFEMPDLGWDGDDEDEEWEDDSDWEDEEDEIDDEWDEDDEEDWDEWEEEFEDDDEVPSPRRQKPERWN